MSTTHDTGSGTIKKFDPENIGIAVGILLLCALELEICLGGKIPPSCRQTSPKTAAGTRVKNLGTSNPDLWPQRHIDQMIFLILRKDDNKTKISSLIDSVRPCS